MYRITLNGTEIEDHPSGWENFVTEVSYDAEYKVWIKKRSTQLKFYGQGWGILKNLYDSGYCSECVLSVERTDNNMIIFDGYIKVTDIEFDLKKKTATVTPIDRVYEKYINNNKSIDIPIIGEYSKTSTVNDPIPITQITPITLHFQVFPDGGIFPTDLVSQNVECFDFKDVMTFIIAWMSDNNLTFESDWYDGLDDTDKIAVVNGARIRGGGNSPIVNFTDLVQTILRLYNLYLIIDEENEVVRIEKKNYLVNNITQGFDDINEMTFNVDQDQLYAGVELGCNGADGRTGLAGRLPIYQFLTFKREKYYFQTQCNIDTMLDLTYPYITDHNVIQDIIINDEDSNDDDIFIINYDANALTPNYGDPSASGDNYVINTKYLNANYIQNYDLYNDISLSLSINDDIMKASLNSGVWNSEDFTTTHSDINSIGVFTLMPDNADANFRLEFNDFSGINYDVNNNFGNYDTILNLADPTVQGNQVPGENSVYEIPTDGLYSFQLYIDFYSDKLEDISEPPYTYDRWYAGQAVPVYNYLGQIVGYSIGEEAYEISLRIKKYDNSYVLKDTYELVFTSKEVRDEGQVILMGGDDQPYRMRYQKALVATMNALGGDIIKYEIGFNKPAGWKRNFILANCIFECTQATGSGGVISSNVNEDFEIGVVKFSKDISLSNQQTILRSPYCQIDISDGTYSGTGLIKSCQIDHTKGMAEFELWVKKSFFED